MRTRTRRVLALVLSLIIFFSNSFVSVAAEETPEQQAASVTLYRYRERIDTQTRISLEEPWTLVSQTAIKQILVEYSSLDPQELTAKLEYYSGDDYYTSRTVDGTAIKYTTLPNGKGSTYYFDEALPDYGMYDESQYTYSEHPVTGIKLYYSDVCSTYTLSVYTRYEYQYWKWSEWSAWSETPCTASETVEVETKESSVLYRYREKQYTTSETELEEPWTLYDTTYEYEHQGEQILHSYYTDESFYTSVYCVHSIEQVNKYEYGTSTPFYATASEYAERLAFDTAHGGSSNIGYYKPTAGYRRYTCCQYKKVIDTTYHYYKWGDWSQWSYTPVEASDDVEVETKIAASYSVTYDANGGTGAPSAVTKEFDETILLSTIIPVRENHEFLGWSTSAQGDVEYSPGGEYSANANVTLYAVWKNVTEYTVSYDANGGADAPSQQNKLHDEIVTLSSEIPTRESYSFLGWATTSSGDVEYVPGEEYSVNADVTLYAIWEEITLDSIEIETLPDKTQYYKGDILDTTGLTLRAIYSDGFSEIIDTGFTCDYNAFPGAGEKTVTVTFMDKTTTFTVVVLNPYAVSVEIATMPQKLVYYTGDTLDLTGLSLNVKYNTGYNQIITSGIGVTPRTFNEVGTKTITVYYDDLPATFDVEVLASEIVSLELQTPPDKTEYFVGERLDTKGLTLLATYNSGRTVAVSSGFVCSVDTLSHVGTYGVIVSYEGLYTSFDITVSEPDLSYIEIYQMPTKTEYYVGDTLDVSGLEILLVFENDSSKIITSGFTCTPIELTSAGEQNIIVTYEGKTTNYSVHVNSIELSELSICTKPTKTVYYVGDQFDPTGLTLTATYNNGATEVIRSGFSCSPETFRTAGTQIITVSFGEKSAFFSVSIRSVTATALVLKTPPKKTTYYIGETLDLTGLELIVQYNNGTQDTITTGFTYSPTTFSTLGEKDIEVQYGDLTATIKVTIISEVYTGKCGDNLYWSLDKENGLLSIAGTGPMYDFEAYESPWFSYADYIASVEIQNGATSIGSSAFQQCTNLKNASIANTVIEIGNLAFASCTSLTKVTLSDNLVSIGDFAFYYCKFSEFSMPASVESIGEWAFCGCQRLTSIVIPDGVTEIKARTFELCSRLVSATLSSSITAINDFAFYYCGDLREIVLPEGLRTIGKCAFSYSGLQHILIPDSVSTIGDEAFAFCYDGNSLQLETAVFVGNAPDTVGADIFNGNKSTFEINYLYGTNGWTTPVWNGYNCRELPVSSISICTMPEVTTYTVNSALDTSGLSITALYEGGYYRTITTGIVCSPQLLSNTGQQNIVVKYGGKSTSFPIDVVSEKAISISITSLPTKTEYREGAEELDVSGGKLFVEYNNGSSKTIDLMSCMVSGFDNTVVGKQELVIRIDEATANYSITVIHDYEAIVTVPTCDEGGYTTHRCAACGNSYVDTYVNATGHDYSDEWTYDKVNHWNDCDCGDKGNLAKHSYTSKVTTAPTCTVPGVRTYTCDCGYSYTSEIPATGHDYSDEWSYDEEQHWRECNCGDKTDITKHTITLLVATYPTCTKPGVGVYRCDCGYSSITDLEAVGHEYSDKGYDEVNHWNECCDCDDKINVTKHSYTSKVTTAPTCTGKGVKTYTCACGHGYAEELDATGHAYTITYRWASDFSCTAIGTCGNCDSTTDGHVTTNDCAVSYDNSALGKLAVTVSFTQAGEEYTECLTITGTISGNTVTITLPGELDRDDMTVIITGYASSGRMMDCKLVNQPDQTITETISGDIVRAFIVSADAYVPLLINLQVK